MNIHSGRELDFTNNGLSWQLWWWQGEFWISIKCWSNHSKLPFEFIILVWVTSQKNQCHIVGDSLGDEVGNDKGSHNNDYSNGNWENHVYSNGIKIPKFKPYWLFQCHQSPLFLHWLLTLTIQCAFPAHKHLHFIHIPLSLITAAICVHISRLMLVMHKKCSD